MSRVASFFFQLQKSSSQSTQLFAHTLEGDITTFTAFLASAWAFIHQFLAKIYIGTSIFHGSQCSPCGVLLQQLKQFLKDLTQA